MEAEGKEIVKSALEFARAVADKDMEVCQLAFPQASQVMCSFKYDPSLNTVVGLG